jgi:hypothetical protein
MSSKLKFPAPWFGGKARVAPLVWSRLGDPANFIEPFCGSGAVLLGRPHRPTIETVNDPTGALTNAWRATDQLTGNPGAVAEVINDLDPYLVNVFRALRGDPDATAAWADRPVSELDLHAIHRWLVLGEGAAEFRERLRRDIDYFCPKRAGFWLFGICAWIGSGWCSVPDAENEQRPALRYGHDYAGGGVHMEKIAGQDNRKPRIDGGEGQYGHGVHAAGEKRPKLAGGADGAGTLGTGVHQGKNGVHGVAGDDGPELSQQVPRLGARFAQADLPGVLNPIAGGTCAARRAWLLDWFGRLRDRLRTVRVCCGHWLRVCDSESVTVRLGTTGLFLDAPYRHVLKSGKKNRNDKLYANDSSQDVGALVDEVIAYCLERGGDPRMRIAACCYEGEGYEVLAEHGWDCVAWASAGGYGNRSEVGKANAKRERIYFSPACLREATLF